MEKRYSGKWELKYCCWSLIRETPTGKCKMEKKTKWVFNGFFCSYDTVHRDTVHYLTLYIVIKNQYCTFLLRT
jgi:hypothetical protein